MNWDELFMRQVYLVAEKSKDPSTKIGCVLTKNHTLLSVSWNGFARGVKDLEKRYNHRDTKYLYVCHGELNCILNCCRNGTSTLDSVLISQGIPCENCGKYIIQAGVKEIVYHKQWSMAARWKNLSNISIKMFKEAGVKIRVFDKVLGIQGFSDGQRINV